jgi:hypothetical protein
VIACSKYVHSEIVTEALRLLCEPEFEEANDESMKAYRYLREGGGYWLSMRMISPFSN